MQKNVASQKIGAQMVSASDGSAFTGSVTVSVTIDAGTQATGTVGSGACTHEGNGYHTYAPSQAETNGTIIAFTFTGTGAVPTTVQVFTTGYDPTVTNLPANVIQVDSASAANLAAHIPSVLRGLTTSGSTTTTVVANASTGINSSVPSAVDDFYNGRVIVFTSGALAGQATSVTDYVGSTQTFTVTALTGSPASGVTFVVV